VACCRDAIRELDESSPFSCACKGDLLEPCVAYSSGRPPARGPVLVIVQPQWYQAASVPSSLRAILILPFGDGSGGFAGQSCVPHVFFFIY